MATDESELDRIDPQSRPVTLVSGFPVEVVRLQTRQLFRLLRIITKGAGPLLAQLDFSGGVENFGPQFLGIIVMAIPDAEAETIAFLQSMCKPAGLIERPAAKITKQDSEHNEALLRRFSEELYNPDPADLISLLEVIVENEAAELQSLGKKLQHLWSVAQKAFTGRDPEAAKLEAETVPLLPLSEPTLSDSISSSTSTDGPTSTSSTSPSPGSGKRQRRPVSAGA